MTAVLSKRATARADAAIARVAVATRHLAILRQRGNVSRAACAGAFGYDLLAPVVRWTPAKQLAVVEAVRLGALTPAEIRAAHGIGPEELRSWQHRASTHGLAALRVTYGQDYRAPRDDGGAP